MFFPGPHPSFAGPRVFSGCPARVAVQYSWGVIDMRHIRLLFTALIILSFNVPAAFSLTTPPVRAGRFAPKPATSSRIPAPDFQLAKGRIGKLHNSRRFKSFYDGSTLRRRRLKSYVKRGGSNKGSIPRKFNRIGRKFSEKIRARRTRRSSR